MKGTFQALSVDIKRALSSTGFFLAVFGVCMVYYAGAKSVISYGDVLFSFKYATEASGFNKILILFCVLPYTTSFCSDWNSKYIRSVVIRMGSHRYALCKIISCAFSSGASVALGIIIFILTLTLRIPLVSTTSTLGSYQQFTTTLGGDFLLNGHYIMYLAVYIYLAFLAGAFWSVVGLCASAYIPNKFVALFAPFIGLYVLGFTTNKFPIWLQLTKITDGAYIFNGTFANLIYATLLITTLIVGVGLLFVQTINRRISNA